MDNDNPWVFIADFDMHLGAVMYEAFDHGGAFEVRKIPQEGKLAPRSAVMVAREHLSEHTLGTAMRKGHVISQDEFAALEVMGEEEFEERIRSKDYLRYACASGGCPLPPDDVSHIGPTRQP
ncbi:MAG: hypothetical protein JKY71_07970 [Alphaproteobacteria bacterium]|nr:hypothetical protein [Alphaproteobacteria bacterium]